MDDFLSKALELHSNLVNNEVGGVKFEAEYLNINLKNKDFSGADLRHASFEGADLAGAIFKGADLENVSFDNAILKGVDFEGANLSGATFFGATLENVNFDFANVDEIYDLNIYRISNIGRYNKSIIYLPDNDTVSIPPFKGSSKEFRGYCDEMIEDLKGDRGYELKIFEIKAARKYIEKLASYHKEHKPL